VASAICEVAVWSSSEYGLIDACVSYTTRIE
jgi:hypothetical protein